MEQGWIVMKHLTECQLTSVFEDTLPAEQEERILLHLAKCEACERRAEPAMERYRALRRDAAKTVPRPPHPWRDIQMEMDRADAILPLLTHSESRKPRPAWTGLVAGAVLGSVLLLWPRPDAHLRAETLLPQIEASISRGPSRARQGLRIRTSTATFVRPALLDAADRSDRHWRERFREAHYDWDDPMSPHAFSEWRNSVKHKSDRVLVSPVSSTAPKQFTIQTTTQENLLEDASLTVDAVSLLPVRARFVFAGEDWIEISVIPSLPPEAEMAVLPGRTLPKSAGDSEAHGALPQPGIDRSSTELAVWLMADRLGDSTSEPIRMDIRGGKRISVTPYSLNAGQLQQLSEGLQGIPGVDLHTPEPSRIAPEAPPERDPAINLSETIFSRAHLLADLAEHFPEAIEMELSLSARTELWQLRSRHASQLGREIQSLQARLKKPGFEPATDGLSEVPVSASLIERLVQEAGRVNRSVTITSAGRAASPEAALALPRLADEIARLKELADKYANSVEQGLEKLR
jgi:hypothetical protein